MRSYNVFPVYLTAAIISNILTAVIIIFNVVLTFDITFTDIT